MGRLMIQKTNFREFCREAPSQGYGQCSMRSRRKGEQLLPRPFSSTGDATGQGCTQASNNLSRPVKRYPERNYRWSVKFSGGHVRIDILACNCFALAEIITGFLKCSPLCYTNFDEVPDGTRHQQQTTFLRQLP
jgi:hypothetical protein